MTVHPQSDGISITQCLAWGMIKACFGFFPPQIIILLSASHDFLERDYPGSISLTSLFNKPQNVFISLNGKTRKEIFPQPFEPLRFWLQALIVDGRRYWGKQCSSHVESVIDPQKVQWNSNVRSQSPAYLLGCRVDYWLWEYFRILSQNMAPFQKNLEIFYAKNRVGFCRSQEQKPTFAGLGGIRTVTPVYRQHNAQVTEGLAHPRQTGDALGSFIGKSHGNGRPASCR